MKKILISTLSILPLLVGCSGSEGTTTWTVSNVQAVSDACEVQDGLEPGTFDITIDGSTVTFAHTEITLEGTATDFSEQENQFIAVNTTEDSTTVPPCTAKLDDSFTVTVGDPNLRLDNNETLTVVWDHTESDVSATDGACAGLWFVDLPCTSQITFTLTKAE